VTPIEVNSHSDSNPASARPGPAPGLDCHVTTRSTTVRVTGLGHPGPQPHRQPEGPPADQPARRYGQNRTPDRDQGHRLQDLIIISGPFLQQ
jgi:hypothetical protein